LSTNNNYRVAAADKVLSILGAFLTTPAPRKLVNLAESSGISRPTAFRLLATLEAQGFVVKNEKAEYSLGYKCLLLGNAAESALELRTEARPIMERLRDLTGESVQIATLEGWQIVYLDRVPSLQAVGYMTSRAGSIFPAYCTGLGKCLLAFRPEAEVNAWSHTVTLSQHTPMTLTTPEALMAELSQTRTRGYSTDNQERELGVSCIAAPIRDVEGNVVAALSVAGPTSRFPRTLDSSDLARQVVHAADAISQRLGHVRSLSHDSIPGVVSKGGLG